MQKKRTNDHNRHLLLNALIGFLGILLLILLFALGTRVLHPRIVADRVVADPFMVSHVIQLEVLNGCGVPGIATRFSDTLRIYGFDVVESGNFDHFNVDKSFVISRGGAIENARRVAASLGISPDLVLREVSPDFYLDVTLVIGRDFESLNF